MSLETVDVSDEDDGPRNLTPADVRAIVRELETAMVNRFYTNLGKGVWAAVWAIIVAGVLFLTAWGAKLNGSGGQG